MATVPAHQASAAVCDTTIGDIWTTSAGAVHVRLTQFQKWVQVCNLNTPWKDIPTSVCFGWFSNLSTAVTTGKTVRFVYMYPSYCNEVPEYGDSPPAYYIMLYNY